MRTVPLLLLATLSTIFAVSTQAEETTTQTAVRATLTEVVQPAFVAFHQAAEAFAQQTASLAKTPSAEQWQKTRAAWKSFSLSWNRVRIHQFGPLTGQKLTPLAYYFDSRLLKGKDFSKFIHQDLRAALAKPDAISAQALASKNFKYQGFPATEIILFDAAYASPPPALATYLHAHAQVLAQRAEALRGQWENPDYIEKLIQEPETTRGKLFNALWDSLSYARKERLGALYNAEMVYPQRAEAWRSRHSKENLSAWLQALKATFRAGEAEGFYALLEASGYASGTQFLQQLDTVQQTLDALPQSLAETVEQDREKVVAIVAALETAMGTFERDVVNILEVNLGFNFNDGD